MIWAITFSDNNYKRSAQLNTISAKVFGKADKVKVYGPECFDNEFILKNKELLTHKRGAGYWVWKPYIIIKTLQECNDGDYVMYLDAGAFYVRKIQHLIENMDKTKSEVFLSSILLPNKHWCKRDAFIKCNCDVPNCVNSHQIEASYVLVKKGEKALQFLRRWQRYASDPNVNTDMPNQLGKDNYPGFRENRHDQTALSLAAYKEGLIGHRGFSDSSEYGIFLKRLKDYGCFGYSKEEIQKMAYDEYQSKGFRESNYKRIIINCRCRDQHIFPFIKSVFRSIIDALLVDIRRNKDVEIIRNMFNQVDGKSIYPRRSKGS